MSDVVSGSENSDGSQGNGGKAGSDEKNPINASELIPDSELDRDLDEKLTVLADGKLTLSEEAQSSFGRGGIVTARGTGEGLVLRLDGRVEGVSLKNAVGDFMRSRRSFLEGQEVAIEWIGSRPDLGLVDEIELLLKREYAIAIKSSRLLDRVVSLEASAELPNFEASSISKSTGGARGTERASLDNKPKKHFSGKSGLEPVTSLFDGVRDLGSSSSHVNSMPVTDKRSGYDAGAGFDGALWDNPDARLVYATLRSGQKIESEHSIVIIGDVNSGAEVISGGDIIVLGNLRGIAHAGAYDETGGGRIIFALNLQPTQLRIGSVISRGSAEGSHLPEIARVEGTLIMVETYQSKTAKQRR